MQNKTPPSLAYPTILFLTFLVAAISILGCGLPLSFSLSEKPVPPSQQTKITPGQLVTLDGYDARAGFVVRWITLWKDHVNRAAGVSATANHGEEVKFVHREGDDVLVETRDGKRGWVDSYFIKEFK